MPDQNSAGNPNSPFEVVTSSKSKRVGKKGILIALVVVAFLVLSVAAGVLLVRQQQNVQEKASENSCPDAEACPVAGQPDLLLSCNPSNEDGTAREISCSNITSVGTTTACGANRYCCPSLGASWTTDLTLCATPSPTPIATATPAATASATLEATATASATPRTQTTPLPVPVTGTDWPTVVGAGVGILVIIGSVLLAI